MGAQEPPTPFAPRNAGGAALRARVPPMHYADKPKPAPKGVKIGSEMGVTVRRELTLQAGGTVVSLNAEGAEEFLPNVVFAPNEVNFWWWLDPLADPNIRIHRPTHPLFNHIRAGDVVWHYHGVLTPPPGAVSLVNLDGQGSLFYVDRASTAGRLIVSTLDPVFHHGSNFMPAATRLLYGLMPWLAEGDLGDAMAPTQAPNGDQTPLLSPKTNDSPPPPRCCA